MNEQPDAGLLLPGHDVPLGRYTVVRRLLPQRARRMIGAWCFVDHFGPDDVTERPGMRIGPHPHTGLQTLSWLVEGEIVHRDSLGSRQSIRPGEVNLMTAGHGIAHSEESPALHPPIMHGLQLWIALPEAARNGKPRFEHHPDLPVDRADGVQVTTVVGQGSPVWVHTPLLGAEIVLDDEAATALPIEPAFEHGVLVMSGVAEVAGTLLGPGSLLYLEPGRLQLPLSAPAGQPARLFLLGGAPFEESLVMWWNFVARRHEEIVAAREDWANGRRFGEVTGYPGAAIPAPELPSVRLKARDRDGTVR
jgi:quercetin 2,3-dioxygenase